jgi:hypothetical protein
MGRSSGRRSAVQRVTRRPSGIRVTHEILAQAPPDRPAFLPAMALSWAYGPSELHEVMQRMGPEYGALSLPHFEQLYRQAGH